MDVEDKPPPKKLGPRSIKAAAGSEPLAPRAVKVKAQAVAAAARREAAMKKNRAAALREGVAELSKRLGGLHGVGAGAGSDDEAAAASQRDYLDAMGGPLPPPRARGPPPPPPPFVMHPATFSPEAVAKNAAARAEEDALADAMGGLGLAAGGGGGGGAANPYVSPWAAKFPNARAEVEGGRRQRRTRKHRVRKTRKHRKFRIHRNPTRKLRR